MSEKPTLDDIKEMLRNGRDTKKVTKAMEESGYFTIEKDYTGFLLAIATVAMVFVVCIIILKGMG